MDAANDVGKKDLSARTNVKLRVTLTNFALKFPARLKWDYSANVVIDGFRSFASLLVKDLQ